VESTLSQKIFAVNARGEGGGGRKKSRIERWLPAVDQRGGGGWGATCLKTRKPASRAAQEGKMLGDQIHPHKNHSKHCGGGGAGSRKPKKELNVGRLTVKNPTNEFHKVGVKKETPRRTSSVIPGGKTSTGATVKKKKNRKKREEVHVFHRNRFSGTTIGPNHDRHDPEGNPRKKGEVKKTGQKSLPASPYWGGTEGKDEL